jgi:hydroxyacylglutathione hydrolase
MKIIKFTLGSFDVNNYLVYSEDSLQAVLIDTCDQPDVILKKIDELNLNLIYVINTHGHGDHIIGNRQILEKTEAKLLIHELDADYLLDPNLNLSAFFITSVNSPPAFKLLRGGDIIKLDNFELKVLHTPGHTPGHITLATQEHAFVGDVIFQGSIGRTDLPLASSQQLVDTIRKVIYSLPNHTILYPGHGPDTTVGKEKESNPFVSM